MAAEPSRRLFGGQAAVKSHVVKKVGALAGATGKRARALLFASGTLLVGSAVTVGSVLSSHHAASARPLKVAAASVPHPDATISRSPAADNDVEARRFSGRVGNNLTASLIAAGVPERQGREYVVILGRAIQLAGGLSVDDKFDLVIERRPDGSLGQLLYVGMDRVARADVELMKWTDGRNVIWVNADGVGGEDNSAIRLPVQGRLTSGFGERFHPILGYVRFHSGVDLAASPGTPIVAAADGRVISAGWHGGYGEQVALAHADGLETSYGHMSRIAAQVGQVVRKGEVIGWVGSTGLSTGPHLHFEVTKNGRPVNPMAVRLASGPGHLEGEKLHQFDATLRGLLLGASQRG